RRLHAGLPRPRAGAGGYRRARRRDRGEPCRGGTPAGACGAATGGDQRRCCAGGGRAAGATPLARAPTGGAAPPAPEHAVSATADLVPQLPGSGRVLGGGTIL